MPPTIYRPYIIYIIIYMAIYGQFYFFCFGHILAVYFLIFHWCERGQGRGAGGSAGGASLTPMKKLGAMTGNFITKHFHILGEIGQKWSYFPEMAPRGSKISVDVFNLKVSDWAIVSAIRKSLTS